MAKVWVMDGEAISIDTIEGDDSLRDRLRAMWPGQLVDLEVAGTVARWERVQFAKAGTQMDAMRPVEAADNARLVLRNQTGSIEIQPFPSGTRLATFEERLHRWDIPQNRIFS